jgi:hypothetical protein
VTSGVRFEVSNSTDGQIPQQIEQAVEFVREHEGELRTLASRQDVEDAFLDFGWELDPEGNPYTWRFLPADLLRLCVNTGLSICVSVAVVGLPDEDKEQMADEGFRS